MYQNIYCNRKTDEIFIWDDESGLKKYDMASFKYAYKRKTGGQYTSIYGDELEKVYNFNGSDPDVFESDVPIETRVLLDLYADSDEPSKNHRIGVVDIEVSTVGGFPNLETADKEITGISLYDYMTRTCYSFILDKHGLLEKSETKVEPWYGKDVKSVEGNENVVILPFDNEENLLIAFMDKWQECAFTVITGWNIDFFDMPYLYLRIKHCLGAQAAKCLSPIGVAYLNTFNKKLVVAGISAMDYILLYKKFLAGKMEPSYALGPIGIKLVGINKLQYKGNLDDLFQKDIKKFLEYNINDVKIVVAIDRKLKLIDLYRNICHVGHVSYDNFHMPSRYLDGASLMYLKRNGNLIAPNRPARGKEEYDEREDDDEEGFSGAYVKEPVPGRYEWIFDLDLASMYPNIIISLNISPETKISKIKDTVITDDARADKRKRLIEENKQQDPKNRIIDSNMLEEWIDLRTKMFDMKYHVTNQMLSYELGTAQYTAEEFSKLISNGNYSLSSNGVLYRQDKLGLVPTLLALWFQQRKEMRKKAAEFKKAGNLEQYEFFNQRQQVWKILLNSFYGVLGLPVFRFYDVDNAEAVTTTGVDIIQTTSKAINIYYKEALETEEEGDWVIYSDTDSCFVAAMPIIKKRFPTMDFNNDDEMTKAIMSVTTEVQDYVNKFYNIMAKRFFNLDKHTFDAKQEVISKSSFWLAKKRYAQWIIHKEGALLQHPELEVKGIDVVRTSFPASFRKFMDGFFRKLLTSTPKKELDDMILKFKEDMKKFEVVDIAKNTSIKFISKDGVKNYNPESRKCFHFEKGTPAQVKAGLAYNDLITKLGLDKTCESLKHGQKIKWVYLQENEYGVEALAFKGDDTDPDEILDFINKNVDRREMFERELKSKMANSKGEGIYDVLKWQFPNPSMATSANFFDFGG